MHQSILAVLYGMATLSNAVAIAPPSDSVSPVDDMLPGVVLSPSKNRDDTTSSELTGLTPSIIVSSVSAEDPVAPFLNSPRAENEVPKVNCKRDGAHNDGCGSKRDGKDIDKAINKTNKELDDKPLKRIADCLEITKDMVQEWCDCMGNCDMLRATYRGLVWDKKNDIKEGLVENHALTDDVCTDFINGYGMPISIEVLKTITGAHHCAPGAKHRRV
jgi:hypothetical protein